MGATELAPGLAELRAPSEVLVTFVHGHDARVLCSGIDFQANAWGAELYTSWLLPPGKSLCYVAAGARLEILGGRVVAAVPREGGAALPGHDELLVELALDSMAHRPRWAALDLLGRLGAGHRNLVAGVEGWDLALANAALEEAGAPRARDRGEALRALLDLRVRGRVR
ncbi:MAG: hypothetical protein ABWK00_05975 [Desulfurococcaceae archaeon]